MSFRIDPRLPLTAEVRRIARGEIEGMLQHLGAAQAKPDKSLHGCRKRIKRVRALLRLVRSGDRTFTDAENARYRDIAASLAGPREAAALIETIDRLTDAFPDQTAGGVLEPVRRNLRARRDGILADKDGLTAVIDAAASSCRAGLEQIDTLVLPSHPEKAADVLTDGSRNAMHKARNALHRSSTRGDPDDFHDLRKAVKAHAMHLSLLKNLWPAPIRAQRKAVEALGEKLGDLHDIFVLRAMIGNDSDALGSRTETKLLDRLLKRAERKLGRTCLKEASRLFSDSPKRSAKKLARKARHDMAESASRRNNAPPPREVAS
jgi:hypothetical protein